MSKTQHVSGQHSTTTGRVLDGVRLRTSQIIAEEMGTPEWSVIHAPPSSGKTTATVELADKDTRPVSYFTVRTNLYKQAEEIAAENGLTSDVIPSPYRDCPTFPDPDGSGGDDEFGSAVDTAYNLGVTAKRLHVELDLPCEPDCPFSEKWSDFEPEENDIIIGNALQANIPSLTEGRIVVFDEFDGGRFITDFENPAETVSYYLQRRPNIPFEDWGDLVEHRADGELRQRAFEQFERRDLNDLKAHEVLNSPSGGIHTKAGWLTLSMLLMNDLGNGFQTTRGVTNHPFADDEIPLEAIEDERRLLGDRTCIWNRTKNTMHLLQPPDLSSAKTVIGLDATPTISMWDTAFGGRFEKRSVVDEREMSVYLKQVMDYEVRQKKDGVKAYYSANSVSTDKDEALFLRTELNEGRKPYLISTQTAINEYERSGALDRVSGPMNFARVDSSNEIEDERLLVISGSTNPGDDVIKTWSALAGRAAEPNRDKETNEGFGMNLSYGEYGDEILHHFRENRIVQSMFRVGRDGEGATIVINTAATPEWLEPDEVISNDLLGGKKSREIIDTLRRSTSSFTQRGLADEVDTVVSIVSEQLSRLKDEGHIELAGTNDDGILEYRWCGND